MSTDELEYEESRRRGIQEPQEGDFEFFDNINFQKIEHAALLTATTLSDEGTMVVGITPDDGTQYHLVISPLAGNIQEIRPLDNSRSFREGIDGKSRIISILSPAGCGTYSWFGNDIHQGYVQSHWGTDSHTSNVVAAFLSLVAYYTKEDS